MTDLSGLLSQPLTLDSYHAFVARLAAVPMPPDLFNPYADAAPESDARQANLALYLQRMAARGPRALLVGEAPGYRGCRVTGVPFTSRSILLAEPSPFGLFGATAGFRVPENDGSRAREATATIMWQTLVDLDTLPLLWNALPFHPYRPDRPDSNRTPTIAELRLGRAIVEDLLALYRIEQVIAVGNKAAESLARWRIDATSVRHPANGGKAAFRRALAVVLRA